MAGGRPRVPWAREPGPRTARRLTDAEIATLREELAAEHRRGLARLARLRRAEIIEVADRGAGSDDENRAGRLNAGLQLDATGPAINPPTATAVWCP